MLLKGRWKAMYRLCSHAWSDNQSLTGIMGVVRNVNHESLIGMSCVISGFGLGVVVESTLSHTNDRRPRGLYTKIPTYCPVLQKTVSTNKQVGMFINRQLVDLIERNTFLWLD